MFVSVAFRCLISQYCHSPGLVFHTVSSVLLTLICIKLYMMHIKVLLMIKSDNCEIETQTQGMYEKSGAFQWYFSTETAVSWDVIVKYIMKVCMSGLIGNN